MKHCTISSSPLGDLQHQQVLGAAGRKNNFIPGIKKKQIQSVTMLEKLRVTALKVASNQANMDKSFDSSVDCTTRRFLRNQGYRLGNQNHVKTYNSLAVFIERATFTPPVEWQIRVFRSWPAKARQRKRQQLRWPSQPAIPRAMTGSSPEKNDGHRYVVWNRMIFVCLVS